MNNIKILDCTLRDGGYINEWRFGLKTIRSMLTRLTKAHIDIIEVGFLEDTNYDPECSFFSCVDQIDNILPAEKENSKYVAMTRYGNLDINHLKPYDGQSIDGIRITFHENEVEEAMEYCKLIKDKGYKVFVQPVGTTSYSDSYLLQLVHLVNELKPYAFYIVDTLGLMKKNDLLKMYYLIDNNLDEDIVIGFHSHNNLQLSYSNAQELVAVHTNRNLIIDSSVHGMGRGAGNLHTELITQYLNTDYGMNYSIDYLLEIVDDTMTELMKKYTWGYSVPYYLAAINNCHPNYATYLMNRQTLPVKSISNILKNITEDKRELYDKSYIEKLYTQYQNHKIDDSSDMELLKGIVRDRELLIIAPGKSVAKQADKILRFQQEKDPLIVSVNFDGNLIQPDLCFFSNDKRYQKFLESNMEEKNKFETIVTSNIKDDLHNFNFRINYSDYLNPQPLVNDNATLMLLSLLIKLGVKKVNVAGFDGFDIDKKGNYAEEELETGLDHDVLIEMNQQISKVIGEYSRCIEINFVTDSLYKSAIKFVEEKWSESFSDNRREYVK